MKKHIEIHQIDIISSLPLQYADEGIKAGFPSPAQDYLEQAIDLNKEIIKHPASTFYGRVVGDSMRDEGIEEGDILVIDKSLELMDGDLAVCFIDGDFTVKRVHLEENFTWLVPANPDYPKIKVTKDNNFIVWGIVTYTIKKTRLSPEIEIYSIDEAFLNLDGIRNLDSIGRKMVERVTRGTGIPVSLGVAPTKTLAKIAFVCRIPSRVYPYKQLPRRSSSILEKHSYTSSGTD